MLRSRQEFHCRPEARRGPSAVGLATMSDSIPSPGRIQGISIRASEVYTSLDRRLAGPGRCVLRRDEPATHDPALLERAGPSGSHRAGDPHRRHRTERCASATVDLRRYCGSGDQATDPRGRRGGRARVLSRARDAGVDRRARPAWHRRAQAAPDRCAVGRRALPSGARDQSRRQQAHLLLHTGVVRHRRRLFYCCRPPHGARDADTHAEPDGLSSASCSAGRRTRRPC